MHEFKPHYRKLWGVGLVCFLAAGVFWLAGVGLSWPPVWTPTKLFVAFMASVLVFAALRSLLLAISSEPFLSVGPEGLFYRPFVSRTVPWRDVKAVAVWRGYARHVIWGKANWVRQPQMDSLDFALTDPSAYPNHPGRRISRLVGDAAGHLPIVIQGYFLTAPIEDVVAAIKLYWPGEIETRESPRPASL